MRLSNRSNKDRRETCKSAHPSVSHGEASRKTPNPQRNRASWKTWSTASRNREFETILFTCRTHEAPSLSGAASGSKTKNALQARTSIAAAKSSQGQARMSDMHKYQPESEKSLAAL